MPKLASLKQRHRTSPAKSSSLGGAEGFFRAILAFMRYDYAFSFKSNIEKIMDDLTKILLTSSATALGATLVFVISQVLGKLVIEPVHDLKKLLGEIRYALVFHAQAILTPVGDRNSEDEAAKVLRKLSCELKSKMGAIPFYDFWAKISRGFIPLQQDAIAASDQLMGLSNSMHQINRSDKNAARISKVEKLLHYKAANE